MLTNLRIANTTFALSAAGVCGASTLISVALSAPLQYGPAGGSFVTLVTNSTSNVPLHVEHRSVFTDILGTSQVGTHVMYLASNAQAFGGSAPQALGVVLLLSGQAAAIPLEHVVGSALQIVIMVASNPASATVVSGSVQVWRV